MQQACSPPERRSHACCMTLPERCTMARSTMNMSRFAVETLAENARFRRYRNTNTGRKNVSDELRHALLRHSAKEMYAVNPITRIRFAQRMLKELEFRFLKNGNTTFDFLTLVVREDAIPFSGNREYDIHAHRKWIREQLAGFDYLGVIEPALYLRAPFAGGASMPWISWHVHLIVWNASAESVKTLVGEINSCWKPFFPGRTAAHRRPSEFSELPERVAYICKLPVCEYNSWRVNATVGPAQSSLRDSMPVTVRWKQKKRKIRPGNLARALSAIGPDRKLLILSIGGGEGLDIWRRCLLKTRVQLQAEQRKRDIRLYRDLYGP